jgi:hypothetical protein
MPYLVQGCLDDHTLAATAGTAKEAFEKAVEWHIVARFTNVSIYDGNKIYSIDEFASAMTLQEIANTAEAASAEARGDDKGAND